MSVVYKNYSLKSAIGQQNVSGGTIKISLIYSNFAVQIFTLKGLNIRNNWNEMLKSLIPVSLSFFQFNCMSYIGGSDVMQESGSWFWNLQGL